MPRCTLRANPHPQLKLRPRRPPSPTPGIVTITVSALKTF